MKLLIEFQNARKTGRKYQHTKQGLEKSKQELCGLAPRPSVGLPARLGPRSSPGLPAGAASRTTKTRRREGIFPTHYLQDSASRPDDTHERPVDNIRPPPPGLGGAAWTPARVGAPQPPRPWPGTQAEGPQQQTRSRHVDSEAAPARLGPLRGACAVGRGGVVVEGFLGAPALSGPRCGTCAVKLAKPQSPARGFRRRTRRQRHP